MIQKSVAQKQPAKPTATAPKQPATASGKSVGFSLEDIQAIQTLVGRHGAKDLKGLIDLVSK